MCFSSHPRNEHDLTIVEGHLALWRNGVHHRDVSASNLMYKDEDGAGVLNDFDLATIKEGVTGNERTDSVPFMAMELLSEKGLAGGIKHVYAHDAESFIWVLVWISLRYEDGKLREQDRPYDEWLKVDAHGCEKEKSYFLNDPPDNLAASKGHELNWAVAQMCLDALIDSKPRSHFVPSQTPSDVTCKEPARLLKVVADESFRKLLHGPLSQLIEKQPTNFTGFKLLPRQEVVAVDGQRRCAPMQSLLL